MAFVMGTMLQFSSIWRPFEQLWQHPRLSREKCTVFNNLCDAMYTIGQVSLKTSQFCENTQVMELRPVSDEEAIQILQRND